MALLLPFWGKAPTIDQSAFLAPTAVIIGDVRIGPEASVWFGAVMSGWNDVLQATEGPGGFHTLIGSTCEEVEP